MSNYKPPQEVISPKSAIKHVRVLEDKSQGKYAIAKLKFHNEWKFACRWNGSEDEPAGHPNSRGIPTWFILPDKMGEDVILGAIERSKIERTYIYEQLILLNRNFDLPSDVEGTSIFIIPLTKITSKTDANLLVEMIKRDDFLQDKGISVFEMDNEGNNNQDPISNIGNKLHITLYHDKSKSSF